MLEFESRAAWLASWKSLEEGDEDEDQRTMPSELGSEKARMFSKRNGGETAAVPGVGGVREVLIGERVRNPRGLEKAYRGF